ncbi:splicing factor, suppressor of white-apricot homolog [Ananas comosus]|uniref:Splicing factor, suppressor of white-apricot homolog n=1 Tax=Ananas comosus TaxID=4615 RepID=A0A6P5G135_ANACO|nr:splicing factor, suppressor of white-apricot homolog [Ananas comosus]
MDLEVSGRHALLFDDDAAAAFVGSASALVPWSADASLLIDRYDVRHLLDRVPPRPLASTAAAPPRAPRPPRTRSTCSVRISPPDARVAAPMAVATAFDLNSFFPQYIYSYLLCTFCLSGSDATAQGAYQSVPFSYGDNDGLSDAKRTDPGMENSCYRPPFPVPENLLSNLPPTEKVHQIIARTALFVSRHGGQSEIVLRVKQGDNPTFGFLMPDNHLHAYFRYLVDHPQLLNEVRHTSAENTKDKELENEEDQESVAGGGALSLLGSVYGSGDDDDSMLPADSKSMEPENNTIATSKARESSTSEVLKDKEATKLTTSAAVPSKEKVISIKSNQFSSVGTISATGSKKVKDGVGQVPSSVDKLHSLQSGVSDRKPLILEPPSSIKRMMEKIVEFILRNGKEFEAVLIEQDKTIGRFPFLLPSHQYHSYYLKILEEAREAKLHGKSSSDQKLDVNSHGGSKKRAHRATSRESAAFDRSSEEPDSWLHDSQRKEKFKMVIARGPKKDPEQPPKQREVSMEEAAAIVLAATRGASPANGGRNVSAEGSGSGRASLSKFASENETGSSLQSTKDDVWIANAIAKTAALVASREADSSEASLTKEQKLKAERLKRAKMFAAMIKSGGHPPLDGLVGSSVAARSGSAEPSNAAGSARSGGESDPVAKEREGSSVPFDTTKHDNNGDNKSRKKRHSREEEEEEEEKDESSKERHKHSRKKHRSEHSTGHSRDDDDHDHDHKHRKRHLSRHHHRHHRKHSSSSEEEEISRSRRHKKSSRSKHRDGDNDNHDDSSEDESRDGCSRRKHRSRSKRERDDGRGEGSESRTVEKSQVETQPAGSAAAVADVPNELRAKVRAMLLETM